MQIGAWGQLIAVETRASRSVLLFNGIELAEFKDADAAELFSTFLDHVYNTSIGGTFVGFQSGSPPEHRMDLLAAAKRQAKLLLDRESHEAELVVLSER